jgi:hypothetical protein
LRGEKHVVEDSVIEIGYVTHFYSKIGVSIVELSLPLSVGDRILVKGPLTDFEQTVESIQIDRKALSCAEGGQSIGLKMVQTAKERDTVYKKI